MKQEVSNKITYYNWFMALCVVYYHWHGQFMDVTNFSQPQPLNEHILHRFDLLANNLGGVAVSYFFMLSGYLLYRNASQITIGEKIKRRVYSLCIPFVLWNCIVILYKYVMFRDIGIHSIKELVVGFTFAPIDGPLWYMLVVFGLALFAPLVVHVRDNKTVLTISLISIAALSIALSWGLCDVQWDGIWYGWYWQRVLSYLSIYILGAYFGLFGDNIIAKEEYKAVLLSIIGLGGVVISAMVFWCVGDEGTIPIIMQRIQTIAIWFAVPATFFKHEPGTIFKSSMLVYAMHQPILIPLTNSWITSAWMNGVYSLAGHIFLSFAAVIVLFLLCIIMIYGMKLILKEGIFAALSGGRV